MNSHICKECKMPSLVQMPSDITCTNCGLEQGVGNMIEDVNWYERTGDGKELFTIISGSSYSTLVRYSNSINNMYTSFKKNKVIMDNLQVMLNITDEVMEECTSLFGDYLSKKVIKTETSRRDAMCAAIHIITSTSSRNGRSLVMIRDIIGADIKNIASHVTHILELLKDVDKWSFIQKISLLQNAVTNASLWRMLSDVTLFIKNNDIIEKYRRTVFTLEEKIMNKRYLLQNCQQNGVNGAILYLAKDLMNVDIKLKMISKVCSSTDATILGIIRKIRSNQLIT